ncbi:hypothetical protein N7535_006314 [Penicillium sp. DV-2018c]|nr:hypothetical protein N7461_007607 [Penicillium sp. DV-2018c]KAJ5567008.1 hypothetical protein N7535_006314 [Penicillium sp. DV-2018c]
MKAIAIADYLEDLGPLQSSLCHSTLATACKIVLEGRGPPDLKDQVIATIAWQEAQLQRVGGLLKHMATQGLITEIVDTKTATRELVDRRDNLVQTVAQKLLGDCKLDFMSHPPNTGHVWVQFNDAHERLIDIVAYNWMIHPDDFDLDRVVKGVLDYSS